MGFRPDYRNIVQAARGRRPERLPLYEHDISDEVIEKIMGIELADRYGSIADRREYFRQKCDFCMEHGYDTVPFEGCITDVIQQARGLCGQSGPLITSWKDLDSYPWQEKVNEFFERFSLSFQALLEVLPEGMKAVGGVGNGIFEVVQDFVPLTSLAYLRIDDPDLYRDLFERVTTLVEQIWSRFLPLYGEGYALLRMGDDLGFSTSTLLHPDDIRSFIIPGYRNVADLVHGQGKQFLLHSCGAIFPVMEAIIEQGGIDAKHSNEDSIAPFSRWVEQFHGKVALFGGIDMNMLCLAEQEELKSYVDELLGTVGSLEGIAIGSGNQIASYVRPENFITMTERVRAYRGE